MTRPEPVDFDLYAALYLERNGDPDTLARERTTKPLPGVIRRMKPRLPPKPKYPRRPAYDEHEDEL